MRALIVAAVMVASLSVTAQAQSPGCTETGTGGHDEMVGDGSRDILCGRGGQDYVNGRGGPDVTRGGDGSDTLVGGHGWDALEGLDGPDELFAVDGQPNELLACGKGDDRAYGDTGDRFRGCEHKVMVSDTERAT
jgi:Ca2+-binding RTX toxin-like protein